MNDLTIKDIVPILRHGAKLLFSVFGVVFLISIITMFLIAPQYEVSTTILIEQEDPSALMLPNPAAILLGSMQGSQNEVELIKSRAVIDTLIEKFNLQFPIRRSHDSFFRQLMGRFRGDPDYIGSPYFLKTHSSLINVEGMITISANGFRIENGDEKADCEWSKPCTFKNGEIVMERVGEIPIGEQYEFSYRNYVRTRKSVFDSYDAFPLGESKSPTLLNVMMQTTNTPFASLFLNELISVFSEKKVQWRTEATEITRIFLEKLAGRLKDERDEKLKKLTTFMSNSRTILPDEQIKTLVFRKLELEQQKKEIDIQRSLIGEFRRTVGEEGPSRMLPAPMLGDDKAFSEMIATYNTLVMEEKKASEIFFDSHPDLIMLRQQLLTARKTISAMADDSDANIRQVEVLLNTKIGEIDNEMRRLPPALSELAVLKAEEQSVEKIYWFLNEKLYENEIKKESMRHDIRIVDPADSREEKLFPRISTSFIIAFGLALLASLSAIFVHYFFRRTIPFGEEIPHLIGHDPLRVNLPRVDATNTAVFDDLLLRLMVTSGLIDKRGGLIAVCGIKQGAGISFIATRLAHLFAHRGYRTALLGEYGESSGKSGKETDIPTHVSFNGDTLAHADGNALNRLSKIRDEYDFIVVDTPPMSISVDAELLAGIADITFLVVRVDWTPRALLRKHYTLLSHRAQQEGKTVLVAVNNSKCILS